MDDLISRSDAIGAVKEERFPIDSDYAEGFMAALDKVERILKEWLPSAQPDGIPIEWIDKHLGWLDNCDNDFAQLAKVSIKAMVELWKKDGI